MSIFDKIKSAIFGRTAHAAPSPTTSTSAPAAPAPSAPAATPSPTAATSGQQQAATPATPGSSPAPSSAPTYPAQPSAASVDIAPILDEAVKKNGQKLDWRHSIVDLMKALGMDASLAERRELAEELGYTGDTNDSAKMNMWLHKALMKKLSENGGKVPAELMD